MPAGVGDTAGSEKIQRWPPFSVFRVLMSWRGVPMSICGGVTFLSAPTISSHLAKSLPFWRVVSIVPRSGSFG